MWPLPTITDHLLTISCTPHELVCSVIRPTRIAHRYELYAYHRYPFTRGECEQLLVCNATLLRSYIQEVVTLYQLENSMAVLVLNGPGVAERMVTLTSAHPTYQQIVDPRLKGFIWDSYYLYPEDSNQYAFYVAGIKQALLLQYKLLFCTLPLHLIGITTESMALLYLYKKLYGSTFRRSQLAHDIQKTDQTLHPLISAELMRRSLAINPAVSAPSWYDSPTLRTALGLYLLGRTAYETN